jgi:hypothetical protein
MTPGAAVSRLVQMRSLSSLLDHLQEFVCRHGMAKALHLQLSGRLSLDTIFESRVGTLAKKNLPCRRRIAQPCREVVTVPSAP